MKQTLRLLFVFGLLAFSASAAFSEEVSYDRYTQVLREKPNSSSARKISANLLTYPFELLRWPTDKGIIYFDRHHLLDKGQWLYEKSIDYGVTPRLNGADFDFMRTARLKQKYPDALVKGWISFRPNQYFVLGGKTGFDRISNTPFRTAATINYENRPEEHFYGIGPNTSKGEGTSYRYEATQVEGQFGYSPDPTWSADGFVGYKHVNITNGEDGGRGIIDETFRNQFIPGLDGDEILSTGVRLVRDKRNKKDNSTRGYLARVAASFNEGLYGSDARYMKYQTEFIKYCRLGSDRRVFMTRFYGEHSNEFRNHNVPFHQMFRLGGYGDADDRTATLRGFDQGRFTGQTGLLFNFEYRYTVYEYKDWKMDTVLFWDEGQAFGHFGKFQIQDFQGSYGGGFRVSILNNTILSVELGHGNEGTSLYVRSRSPF